MVDWDGAFVICGAIVTGVAVLWGLCYSIVHWSQICRATGAFIKALTVCRGKTAETKYLAEQVALEKKKLAEKVLFLLLFLSMSNLVVILYNVWMERPRWMSTGGCWVLLVGIVLLLLAHIPSVLSAHTLDFWSMVLQLTVLAFISPLATSADEVVIAATGLFMGVCIPATAFTTRSTVLLFCHAAFLFNAVVRVIIDKEEFKIASQCSVMNNPSTFILAHIIFVPFAFSSQRWAHQLMQQRVEARFRESKSNTQLSAATALLNLTCDAVVELDEDGRLLSHNSSLAAVLMRNRPGATLEGTKFIDFVIPTDSERVSEMLENHGRDSNDALAYAFRTHLVDSYASKFRTEVFQVKYTMESGEKCHIIGLRDFTDQQPLAVENASADAFRASRSLDSLGELTASRQLSELSEVRTVETFDVDSILDRMDRLPVSRQPSLSSNLSLESREGQGERIERAERVERPVRIKSKDAFLEIDLEEELVKSATAPFSHLVGKRLCDISFSDYALQTCKTLCRDAQTFRNSQETVSIPDQIATFNNMPLLLAPRLVEATGLMKVSSTDLGALHVIVCVRQRRISANAVNSASTSPHTSTSSRSALPLSI